MAALLLAALASPQAVQLAQADVIIRQYIEGSGNNKCIEIYNGTGAAVNMGALGYTLQIFYNGNSSPNVTINLSGTVADGDVYVICNSSASGGQR